jgi:hypothetical protein
MTATSSTAVSAAFKAGSATIPSDAKLTRDQTAQALTNNGFPTAAATLATLASRGGGPPYQRYGRAAIYTWGTVLQWALGRMSPPAHSATERKIAGLL